MNSVGIHRVTNLIIKEPSSIVGQSGIFWTRKIFVTDIDGHKTEITLHVPFGTPQFTYLLLVFSMDLDLFCLQESL